MNHQPNNPVLMQAAYREARRKGFTCLDCEHNQISKRTGKYECHYGNSRYPHAICGRFDLHAKNPSG